MTKAAQLLVPGTAPAAQVRDIGFDAPFGQTGPDGAPEPLSLAHFNFIRRLAMRHAGIHLADHKHSMVQRRLTKRLAALGLDSFEHYHDLLAGPGGPHELQALINALTTNKTEFFREKHHFDHLAATVLRSLAQSGRSRRLRIWSAGCSSGQEAYSIAMTLSNCIAGLSQWDARILATDIDTDVIEQARLGIYPADELTSIPASFRDKFIEPVDGAPQQYQVTPSLRDLVTFKPLNLHGSWPMKGPFDVVFCRNVVIYFDKPTQAKLFDRCAEIIGENGYLYIGHSESLYRVTERFRPAGQSIYQKIA